MSYTIGSFNLLKLSYQKDDEIRKDYRKIAQIINDENFDVVALQEVLSDGPIKNSLLPELGSNKWDYVWEAPNPFSSSSNEGYAFIWRKRRLGLVEAGDNPKIYNQYSIREPSFFGGKSGIIGKKGLIRPPFVARFTPAGLPGGSNFEIRLINTHIIFGRPSHAESFISDTDLSDHELRRCELKTLSESIYRMVSTKRYGDNLPAYTILLGDYNLCLCGPGPKIDAEIKIDERRNLLTVQTEKTSLKQPSSNGEPSKMVDADHYAHNYDHFSYETGLMEKIGLTASRVDALTTYYKNDLAAFRKEVSDHVPIKLVLDLKLHERA